MEVDELLLLKLEQFGYVNNSNRIISVLYNLKKERSSMTAEEIEELFSETQTLYYYENAKDENDFEDNDYCFGKGKLIFKAVKLNTDLNKYKFPLYVGYKYSSYYQSYSGVFINDIATIFERNFVPRYYQNEESKPEINNKIASELAGLAFEQNNLSENEPISSTLEPNKLSAGSEDKKSSNSIKYPIRDLALKIYNNIYNVDEWGDNEEEQKNKLDNYVYYLKNVIANKINNNTLDAKYYFKYTTEYKNDYYIFNTRLLDKYASWIYVCYLSSKRVINSKVVIEFTDEIYVSNRFDLTSNGITIDDYDLSSIEPIKFYNNKADLIFDAEIENFELEITNRNFTHIIEEHRDRLPIALQNQSVMDIAYRIRNSIEYAIKMSKADYNYIIPCYNIERDAIQYMLPLFSSFDTNTRVESVLIVSKLKYKYIVNTVLKVEDAYQIARILNRPTASWFK